MKIGFENNRFVLSDIDYELMETILNGLTYERNLISEKIATLSDCLFKDYSQDQKEEFKTQIGYMQDKQSALNQKIHSFTCFIEDLPL